MQTQSTATTTKKTQTKPIKVGSVVEWNSQAGGVETTKRGTVVCVLKKDQSYYGGHNLPKSFMVPLYKEAFECTQKEARERLEGATGYTNGRALQAGYRLKFSPQELGSRPQDHYLIEVDKGEGRKSYLYHPAYYTNFKVIK